MRIRSRRARLRGHGIPPRCLAPAAHIVTVAGRPTRLITTEAVGLRARPPGVRGRRLASRRVRIGPAEEVIGPLAQPERSIWVRRLASGLLWTVRVWRERGRGVTSRSRSGSVVRPALPRVLRPAGQDRRMGAGEPHPAWPSPLEPISRSPSAKHLTPMPLESRAPRYGPTEHAVHIWRNSVKISRNGRPTSSGKV